MDRTHHGALQQAATIKAAADAYTPPLQEILEDITARTRDLATIGPLTKACTAHQRLARTKARTMLNEAYARLGAHMAPQLPPHWGMGGWGMRHADAAKKATWAPRGGRGMGAAFPSSPAHAAYFAGLMAGIIWCAPHSATRPDSALWHEMAGQAHPDWAFLTHSSITQGAWDVSTGASPHDAALATLAHTLGAPFPKMQDVRDHHAGFRHPAPHQDISKTTGQAMHACDHLECYHIGFANAAHAARQPLIWAGAHLLWGEVFHHPVSVRLMGGKIAARQREHYTSAFQSTTTFYSTHRFQSRADVPAHEATQWNALHRKDMADMRALIAMAEACTPGTKKDWIVADMADPQSPVYILAQGWCPTSAMLWAALTHLRRHHCVPDMSHWEAWSRHMHADTDHPSLAEIVLTNRTAW